MESVNIVTASLLLGICRQRLQQLIYADRVRGAFKTRQGWQIPLYKGMPRIVPAKRGVKGTWRLRPGTIKIIYINRHEIKANKDRTQKKPVISVRKGQKGFYGHQVTFTGKCTIVYEPENEKKHGGATVWIEVDPTVQIRVTNCNKKPGEQVKIVN